MLMSRNITIRPCKRNENFLSISKLYLRVWKTAYKSLLSQKFLSKLNEGSWKPQKRWKNTMIAENKKKEIVGVCSFGPTRFKRFPKYGEIYSLYVDKDYQDIGVGSKLIKQSLKKLKRDKYKSFFVWVIYNNSPAINFYKKVGFKDPHIYRVDHSKFGDVKEMIMLL